MKNFRVSKRLEVGQVIYHNRFVSGIVTDITDEGVKVKFGDVGGWGFGAYDNTTRNFNGESYPYGKLYFDENMKDPVFVRPVATCFQEIVNGGVGVYGTNHDERMKISREFIAKHPESVKVKIKGFEVELYANYSCSNNLKSYSAEIPLELYKIFFTKFGLIQKEPKAYISIWGDMTTVFTTNSKKPFYKKIPNSIIEILDEK